MENNEYFKEALSNFTFDVASKGAIRHLADKGYTPQQIVKMLDFPTPYERIQDEVWRYLIENRTLILSESELGCNRETYAYVTEYDAYGKKSFRRVSVDKKEDRRQRDSWNEKLYQKDRDGLLNVFLAEKCRENMEKDEKKTERNTQFGAYISCDFGLQCYHDPESFIRSLDCLEKAEREYVLGIPWEKRKVYHRLDARMRKIAAGLYDGGSYHADIYFLKTGERFRIDKEG